MNAGIGASRAFHAHRPAFDPFHNFFEDGLDSREPGLHLPAVKISAVVGDDDANAARQNLTLAVSRAW